MSDTTAIISACLILMSLYTTFQLGIECERERARQARRRRFEEDQEK
mgnify:CR=1 FL=1|jgi:hypothetical protein